MRVNHQHETNNLASNSGLFGCALSAQNCAPISPEKNAKLHTRDTEHPLWPLYLVAKQLVQASQPTEESLMPIVSRLDAEDRCPLEALIIRRLLIQAANFTGQETVEPEPQPQPMPVDDGGLGCLGVIKIIFYIFIFAGLIGKILHLFG